MKTLKFICKLFIIKQDVPTNILIYRETLEYSRSEDSPDPWPCRQSRRCPNSQAVSRCPSCCTQKLYGGKTHTNTGVKYHPFPAFTGFFQKRELTHCQNLTRCYSSHCYRTLSDCSQLFCRHKRTEYHKLWFTTLFNSVTKPSGNHPENHNLQATPKLRRKATRVCVTPMSVVQRLSNLFVLQTNFTDLSVKLETVQYNCRTTWSWLVKVKLLKLCRTTRSYPSELLCALVV